MLDKNIDLNGKIILVTGSAGFIGANLVQVLIRAKVLPADYDFEDHKELVPMQSGDVPVTYADTTPLERDFGFKPNTPLRTGLRRFAEWYADFYMRG